VQVTKEKIEAFYGPISKPTIDPKRRGKETHSPIDKSESYLLGCILNTCLAKATAI
jgi:hypothetical protein